MSEPSEPAIAKMEAALQQTPQVKRLIVGLDFGTTYVKPSDFLRWHAHSRQRFSGIAWMELNSHDHRMNDAEIRTVRAWPSSHGPNQDESKVPSRLIYNAEGEVVAWGYEEADADGIIMEWFKLAIVPVKDLPLHLRNSTKLKETKKQMRKLRITPTQVITEYIHKIWTHAKGEIKKTVGQRDFKTMPIHVVFTIPAIWKDQQIKIMEHAAAVSILQSRTAGVTTYEFISEPEAAVQAYARQLQNKLGKNEIVLVPDIGGGTGDAIPYEKVGVGEKFYLELREAATGNGMDKT
jgi:hypothetical protein